MLQWRGEKLLEKKIFFREITQVHEFVCFHGIFENSFFFKIVVVVIKHVR